MHKKGVRPGLIPSTVCDMIMFAFNFLIFGFFFFFFFLMMSIFGFLEIYKFKDVNVINGGEL